MRGVPLVKGKRVTGFANTEEEAVQLTHVVPFLVEDELKRLGGLYEKCGAEGICTQGGRCDLMTLGFYWNCDARHG